MIIGLITFTILIALFIWQISRAKITIIDTDKILLKQLKRLGME